MSQKQTMREWMTEHKGDHADATELAMAAISEHVATSCGRTYRVAREVMGEAAPPKPSDREPKVSPAAGGFSLEGRELLAQKPTSAWPARFRALRRGAGYRLEDLAAQWHASVNTIREKARDHKCLRYTNDDTGQYIPCVVHPDTPGGK